MNGVSVPIEWSIKPVLSDSVGSFLFYDKKKEEGRRRKKKEERRRTKKEASDGMTSGLACYSKELMLGSSGIEHWLSTGWELWKKDIMNQKLRVFNAGVGGDKVRF